MYSTSNMMYALISTPAIKFVFPFSIAAKSDPLSVKICFGLPCLLIQSSNANKTFFVEEVINVVSSPEEIKKGKEAEFVLRNPVCAFVQFLIPVFQSSTSMLTSDSYFNTKPKKRIKKLYLCIFVKKGCRNCYSTSGLINFLFQFSDIR